MRASFHARLPYVSIPLVSSLPLDFRPSGARLALVSGKSLGPTGFTKLRAPARLARSCQGDSREEVAGVSPSGFSELEMDQGIVARMLNYGTIEVRSQGGQQLKLELVRNPREVSAKIRDVMTTPTVRIATDQPVAPVTKDEKK